MMGVVTLNTLLTACTPIAKSSKEGGKVNMPPNFAHDYFREVSNHGEALW